jgi:hypothetical protein
MSAEFGIGAAVVCVEDRWHKCYAPGVKRWPYKGEILTVRDVVPCTVMRDVVGLLFVEFVNPPLTPPYRLEEPAFHSACFRPVFAKPTYLFSPSYSRRRR